ncbi:MAG: Ig-like domain repeat protein [Spirochaetota bacterium]|nr:Ig-like domain repeat protein [Spirochaetota bacterium]
MKRKNNLYVIFILISSMTIWFVNKNAFCLETKPPKEMSQISKKGIRRVAVLPLVNLSGSDVAAPDVIAMIENYLSSKMNIEVVPREIVKKFLVKERIRGIGLLSRATSRTISNTLKVDGIILTCVNLLTAEDNPMIGIGCRMINGRDGSLIWYNHASLAGRDYTSWFGLIRVTSLEVLTTRAVERLLSTFPKDVIIMQEDIDSFEITEISANPKYLHSHEKIILRVKFVSMGKTIKRVNAILDKNRGSLVSEEELVYSGTMTAPSKEGKYQLNLEVYDEGNNVSIINSVAIIRVDNTPPSVALYSRDELFSPNGDRIKDMIVFSTYLREADNIDSWEFIVQNSEDEIIRRASGRDRLATSLVWRGEDDSYSSAGDGEYYCSLKVIDRAGNKSKTPRKRLVLDKTPPKVQIKIDLKEEEGFQFYLECEDANGIDRWQLDIFDEDQRIVQSFEGEGRVPANLWWKTSTSPHIESRYSFTARDLAGNRLAQSARPIKADFLIKEVTPSNKEEKRKEWNSDF